MKLFTTSTIFAAAAMALQVTTDEYDIVSGCAAPADGTARYWVYDGHDCVILPRAISGVVQGFTYNSFCCVFGHKDNICAYSALQAGDIHDKAGCLNGLQADCAQVVKIPNSDHGSNTPIVKFC